MNRYRDMRVGTGIMDSMVMKARSVRPEGVARMLVALLFCLCVAGCGTPQADVEKPAGVEEEEEAGGGVRTLTLAFETPARAELAEDRVTPRWETGDEIWLSRVEGGYETVTLAAGDITELEGGANCATISTSLTGTLYAVYPSSAVERPSETVTNGSITLKLPETTDGSFAKAHIAVAKSDKDRLFFRNAVSILEFSGFDSRISSIDIKENALCSAFNVKYGDPLEVSSWSRGKGLITVSGMAPGKPIDIPVAPGTAIPADAVFTFRNSAGAVIRRMTHKTALTPSAGGIYELGAASLPAVPEDAVPGLFSVSPSRQVFFAKSNLTSSGTFTDSQLDYGDLFSSEEAAAASFPANWRLLTGDELNYLFSARTAADGTAPSINGKSAIYLKCKVNDVNGVLLVPDAFVWPSGIDDSKAGCANDWTADFSSATFDSDEFATLEAAGCVFLPASGFRSGGNTYNVGSQGYYRTTTGTVLSFNAEHLGYEGTNDPATGESIRLVTDV